jgi:hypothetical protein
MSADIISRARRGATAQAKQESGDGPVVAAGWNDDEGIGRRRGSSADVVKLFKSFT